MFSIKFKRIHTGPAGFTLIELIITVAVIGILAGIGFPSIMKWVPNYKIKAAAQELNGNMQKARLDAIKTNSKVSASSLPKPSMIFISSSAFLSGSASRLLICLAFFSLSA